MLEKILSKKQLRWQCRRGMLELDILLGRFLERYYNKLTKQQQQQFANLLTINDTELYDWLLRQQPVKQEFQIIVQLILDWQHDGD